MKTTYIIIAVVLLAAFLILLKKIRSLPDGDPFVEQGGGKMVLAEIVIIVLFIIDVILIF